jgi:hypothetical protein
VTRRNLLENGPNLELERSSLEVHRVAKASRLTGEVTLQLGDGCSERAAVILELHRPVQLLESLERRYEFVCSEELAAADALVRSRQEEGSPG